MPKKMGRPTKTKDKRLTHAILIRVAEADIKRIQAQAFLNKTSVAEYARTALISSVENSFDMPPDITALKKIKANSSS